MFGLEKRKQRVTILGSCVSRDIMEYVPADKWELNLYTARTKVVSQLSPSLDVPVDDVHLDSAFQKRIVMNDLNKEQFAFLEKSKKGYCIIDFIDERFNLVSIEGSYITKSNELINSGWLSNKRYNELQYVKSNDIWSCGGQELKWYLKTYCDKILKCFTKDKIIMHKAYMVNSYIDKAGNQKMFAEYINNNNQKINEMLRFMYDYMEEEITKLKIIDITNRYIADENHKWGLSLMHYQEEYYREAARILRKYMKI